MFAETGDHGDGGKFDDLFLGDFLGIDVIVVFAEVKQADGLHDFGDVHSAGAADHALMAGCAEPDGVGAGDVVQLTEGGQVQQLARGHVHGVFHGAGTAASAALHTYIEILTADFFHFADEVEVDSLIVDLFSHLNPCIVSVKIHKIGYEYLLIWYIKYDTRSKKGVLGKVSE